MCGLAKRRPCFRRPVIHQIDVCFERRHVLAHRLNEVKETCHGVAVGGKADQGLLGCGHFHVALGHGRRRCIPALTPCLGRLHGEACAHLLLNGCGDGAPQVQTSSS